MYKVVQVSILFVALILSACSNTNTSKSDSSGKTPEKSNSEIESIAENPSSPEPAVAPKAVVDHDGGVVQQSVEHLFEIIEGGDNAPAAEFLAYRGEDKSREWKTGYNYEDPTEKEATDKVCRQLEALQLDLDHYEFIEFFKEKESEGEWNVWEMKFHYKNGTVEDIAMAFLRINGHYLLGDID